MKFIPSRVYLVSLLALALAHATDADDISLRGATPTATPKCDANCMWCIELCLQAPGCIAECKKLPCYTNCINAGWSHNYCDYFCRKGEDEEPLKTGVTE